MNNPFVVGQSYARSALLKFVGSKQAQSGIIWGPVQSDVVICTSGGRHGVKAGYEDRLNDDGTWDYFGQGETGDQDSSTFANRLLVEGKRSVLLFRTKEPRSTDIRSAGSWKKSYTFVGEFCTGSWDLFVPVKGPRKGNQLIKFTLVPTGDSSFGMQPAFEVGGGETSEELKKRIAALGTAPKKGKAPLREYYLRSDLLRRYAKLRAAGFCEYCGKEAPFVTTEDGPYLEVHHIFRLADDGPDAPENVACLCPNCHRQAHYGRDRVQMQNALAERIGQKELLPSQTGL